MVHGDTSTSNPVYGRLARWTPRALAGFAACGALVLSQATAAPSASTLPLAPYGDSPGGPSGAVCVLSPDAFLVAAEGADRQSVTADDLLLHMTDLGGERSVTPIEVPYSYRGSGNIVRLSATSVVVRSSGADGAQETADDALLLVERIGAEPVVTPVVVGALGTYGGYTPTVLGAGAVAVMSQGPDLDEATADDEIVLVTDLGGANTVQRLAAPFLRPDGRHSQPVALSPTSFLVASAGPDGNVETGDDLVYVFTDAGGSNRRQVLQVPEQASYRGGRPVRVSATRAVMATAGPDGEMETPDDVLVLLDDLGGANTLTPIATGSLTDYGGGVACVLSETLLALVSLGPDGQDETADDELLVISNLGTTNDVDRILIGGLDEDAQCRPVRLSPTAVAFAASGPDHGWEGADDEVVVVSDLGGANRVQRRAIGGLSNGSTSSVRPLSATAFTLVTGGPNHQIAERNLDEHDDTFALVRIGPQGLEVEEVTLEGLLASTTEEAHVPVALGRGRAAVVTAGGLEPNDRARLREGDDDAVELIEGLPRTRSLELLKVRLRFDVARPKRPAHAHVKAALAIDEPELLLGNDLTVSVGHAAQTIPAGAFARKGKHKLTYRDRRGKRGILRRLTYDLRKGTLKIALRGRQTGIETTSPDSVRIALQVGDLYLADEQVLRKR